MSSFDFDHKQKTEYINGMSSVNVAINEINEAASIIVLVLSFICFILGGIGLMFNVLVFTRVARHEPCAIYFFW